MSVGVVIVFEGADGVQSWLRRSAPGPIDCAAGLPSQVETRKPAMDQLAKRNIKTPMTVKAMPNSSIADNRSLK